MGALNDKIFVMREAISKLTQILAGKHINVTQRGIQAYVKSDKDGRPTHVNLPFIPDNATTELIDAIQGFLDHEVAHILFTDFKVMTESHKRGIGNMCNVLEDIRIERKMSERFDGSAENLKNTGRFFLDNVVVPALKKAQKAGDETAIIGALTMPLLRMMGGQFAFKDFMKDKMHLVKPLLDKIEDLEPQIRAMETTTDAMNLAKVVKDRMFGASAPPPAGAPGAPDDEEEPPAGAPAGAPAPGGDPDEEEGSLSLPAPPAAGGDEQEELVMTDDEESTGTKHFKKKNEGSAVSSEMDVSKSDGLNWEEIDKEAGKDYDDAVSHAITDSAVGAAESSEYLVFTKEKDVVEPLKIGSGYTDDMLKRLVEDVEHMVGPLQKDLERAISARSLSQWAPGQRSGRLNAGALSRLALGDARVFRRKTEVSSKDVAVELVIDISGSMEGSKVATATKAAYALASVLERIGIPCDVICFTTGSSYFSRMDDYEEQTRLLGRTFSRNESLYMPILKSFEERMSPDVKKRFGWLPNISDMRSNIDGESIEIAARRLMGRRETGKVMMVLSDGAPAGSGSSRELHSHLKRTVAAISKAGVNVIGIGIQSDAVRQFYPKSLMLNNVSELPLAVMKELRALIVK